jgi:hypothetical protein
MQERPENFNAAGGESEATLVAPRFDAEEARHAHPVVPLAEAPTRAPFVTSRARARRGLRLSWPPALLAVALLAAAAVGGAVATKVFRTPQPNPAAAAQAPAAPDPAPTAETPAEAPPEAQAPPAAAAPREETQANQQPPRTSPVRDGAEEEARAAAAVPPRIRRDDGKAFEGEDESRRGRGKGRESRRAREEDDVEKEIRKTLKDAKGKAPRLVDVITSRSN